MSNRQKLLIKEGLDKFLAQPTHDLDKICSLHFLSSEI